MNANALFGLEGKRIMVLGGGQGMGEATVKLLTQLGCAVAVVDLQAERAEGVAGEAREAGATALPFAVDVTDDDALVATIARVERELGPLDGMATIIGMAGWSSITEMTMETWEADHRRNLRYFFFAAREVARRLIARGAPGTIVAVASVDGLRSAPNHAAYGAAKAGLINLVKTMATEWAEAGIRVNCVAPGWVDTDMSADPLRKRRELEKIVDGIPLRRVATADDVAGPILFLASEAARHITGEVINVNGGSVLCG